jgi:transcriptional regulator with XRE-family HTH domain
MKLGPRAEEVFARRTRELREQEEIPQTVLAERLDIHGIKLDGTAITRIERGTRAIRLNEAVAIAAALDVSLDAMLHPGPSPEDALTLAHDHTERTYWYTTLAAAEHEAAKARERRLRMERDDQHHQGS